MSGFAEKRKFFLEVIDDMAKEEVESARLLDQVAEEIANPGPDVPRFDDDLGKLPESLRPEIEAASVEELLSQRRIAAKVVCHYISDVGFIYIQPVYEGLLATVERLRLIDNEVIRRHLVAGDPPPV
jgi:hypothetical protein